jgi:hypothetical protein
MPSFDFNTPFVHNKLLILFRDQLITHYHYAFIFTFICLLCTIYMLHGITNINFYDIHPWVKPFHNMRRKPCLNLPCTHIACYQHVTNQCHTIMLCYTYYNLLICLIKSLDL